MYRPTPQFLPLLAGCLLPLAALAGCASKMDALAGDLPRPRGVDLYVKGAHELKQGQRPQAMATLASALQTNPDLIMPRSLLGEVYRSQNQYDLAADQYQVLVVLDPYTPANHYYLGLCYQFLDRIREAVGSYLKALRLSPRDARANMNLGLAYLSLDRPSDAVTYIEKATQLDPRSAAAWANLGVALDARGSYARAESAYRRSLELDSNQPATMINLGANLIQQNKPNEAIAILQHALKQQNTALARKNYGDALVLAQRYDEAIDQYHQALALDPRYAPALNSLASALIGKYQAGSELDDSLRAAAVANWKKSLAANTSQRQITALVQKWDKQPMSAK